MNLNAELFRQLSVIADDEKLMEKALKALRRLAKERLSKIDKAKEAVPYTMEELDRWLDEGEAEEGGTSSHDVFTQMEKKYPWLCE